MLHQTWLKRPDPQPSLREHKNMHATSHVEVINSHLPAPRLQHSSLSFPLGLLTLEQAGLRFGAGY